MSHKIPFFKLFSLKPFDSQKLCMCTMHVLGLLLVPNNPAQPLQTDNVFDDQLQSGDVVYENPNHSEGQPGRTVEERGKYKSLWKLVSMEEQYD